MTTPALTPALSPEERESVATRADGYSASWLKSAFAVHGSGVVRAAVSRRYQSSRLS
jgi:hypothetical protein